jgi:hypothetical protein
MSQRLMSRVEYGDAIRIRALCLMEAHGRDAEEIVRQAAAEAGLTAADRSFLDAVAERLVRLGATRGTRPS